MKLPTPPLILVYNGIFPDETPIISIFQDIGKINGVSTSLSHNISAICIGTTLINNLKLNELRALIAHELAHIKHYHSLKQIFVSITTPIILDSIIPNKPSHFSNPQYKSKEQIKSIIKKIMISYFSRIFEKQADLTSIRKTQNPQELIDALNKIYEIMRKKHKYVCWVDKEIFEKFLWFISSHPTLEKRIEYLSKEIKQADNKSIK